MKKSKVILTIISLVLVVAMSVAGTLAFLKVNTTPVVNTFSPSNIGLTLDETTTATDYKMIPGVEMKKDPKVTVTADIDTYVFVKVKESANFDDYMTYAIASGWKLLDGSTTIDTVTEDEYVLYREVTATEASVQGGASFYVLAGGTKSANGVVTTKTTVKEADMTSAKTNAPTLTFTAYAVQKDAMADVNAAWTEAQAQ